MKNLIARMGHAVKAVLTGFDRIVFKGLIRPLAYAEGAMKFLNRCDVLNKDYKRWMMGQTDALVKAVDRYAQENGEYPIVHLQTWRKDKEELAKKRQEARGIKSGLLGVWSCLETGSSYRARYSPEKGCPQLRPYRVPCKHLYLYFDHEQYGFMSVRLQTWFPYSIQVCMNGREWLRRRLEAAGVEFVRRGNKFFHIEDYAQAQRFLDEQLSCNWTEMLESFLPAAFPTMRETLGEGLRYYWTMWQSEWATDFVLSSPEQWSSMTEGLVRHAMITGTATRVLRYLGRPLTVVGQPYKNLNSEVYSRLLEFHDGVRVRHWVGQNSVKAYNEQNILRAEVTINDPGAFRVHRRLEGEGVRAPKKLRPLRKGVADVPLRAQVSQEINDRFTDGLATVSDSTPVRELLDGVTCGWIRRGRRIRPLDPTGKDRELLEALADPAFSVAGITNTSLRERLKEKSWGAGRATKQLSARTSRHLRLLRDHGLLKKMPNQRRYQLTAKGRQLVTALSALLAASTQQLMEMVA